jgi:DNA invertase Pin-like site-specific DNA recombinase
MENIIGYARVFTTGQNPALQLDAVNAAGAVRIFTDYSSGASIDRPELAKCLDSLQPGNVLAVWRIDRLGRSVPHLVSTVAVQSLRAAAGLPYRASVCTAENGFGSVIYERYRRGRDESD